MLVRQVQAGELQAFAELVRKYQDRVYNTCWRVCGHAEDARDLTQEAFLKAFEAIERFRGKSAFYTWIFRIAVNLSISHKRKRRRMGPSLDDPLAGEAAPEATLAMVVGNDRAPDPVAESASKETHAQVALALTLLEPAQRAVIVLRDVEGLDYQEIADILELPVGTVKSRIYRGRMALCERLRRRGIEEPE